VTAMKAVQLVGVAFALCASIIAAAAVPASSYSGPDAQNGPLRGERRCGEVKVYGYRARVFVRGRRVSCKFGRRYAKSSLASDIGPPGWRCEATAAGGFCTPHVIDRSLITHGKHLRFVKMN